MSSKPTPSAPSLPGGPGVSWRTSATAIRARNVPTSLCNSVKAASCVLSAAHSASTGASAAFTVSTTTSANASLSIEQSVRDAASQNRRHPRERRLVHGFVVAIVRRVIGLVVRLVVVIQVGLIARRGVVGLRQRIARVPFRQGGQRIVLLLHIRRIPSGDRAQPVVFPPRLVWGHRARCDRIRC